MPSFLYDAAKDDIFTSTAGLNPEAATFFRDEERICWHRWYERWWDRLRGYSHPPTHSISVPFIHVALVDSNGRPLEPQTETKLVHITWKADGTFTIDD